MAGTKGHALEDIDEIEDEIFKAKNSVATVRIHKGRVIILTKVGAILANPVIGE
jgi:hypothetical protein